MTNKETPPTDILIRYAVQAWNTSIVETSNDFDRMKSTLTAIMPQLIETTTKPVDVAAVRVCDHASAARLNRLLTTCHGLRWTDVGLLALDNDSTKKALLDLSEILFMDGIDESIAIRALSTEPAQQPDDTAVNNFAACMKAKLALKRAEGRSGWQGMSAHELTIILRQHVDKGDPIDVANLCMMLSENGQRIVPAELVQESFTNADWFYRDNDPDDNGDTPYEALSHHPEYSVHLVHSSFRGDSRYVFRAPTLDQIDDDDEVLDFETEEEAIAAAQDRKTTIDALSATPTPEASHDA